MNFICYQNDEEKEDSDSDMKKKVRFFTDNIIYEFLYIYINKLYLISFRLFAFNYLKGSKYDKISKIFSYQLIANFN